MDLIVAYQNELLALTATLIVIFISLTMKRKTTNLSTQKSTEEVVKAERTRAATKEIALQQEEKTEGDFRVAEEKAAKKIQTKQKVIKKREVPLHTKITRDDFKKFSGQRILLVEDNIINQKVILGLWAGSGIDVVVANDGVEALEILEKDNNFILILMDAHMPRMDGLEATRKIRKNPALNHIAVVALSGDTTADSIKKMTESGMSDHLEKPLRMDALYDIVYAYTPDKNTDSSLNHTDIYL